MSFRTNDGVMHHVLHHAKTLRNNPLRYRESAANGGLQTGPNGGVWTFAKPDTVINPGGTIEEPGLREGRRLLRKRGPQGRRGRDGGKLSGMRIEIFGARLGNSSFHEQGGEKRKYNKKLS